SLDSRALPFNFPFSVVNSMRTAALLSPNSIFAVQRPSKGDALAASAALGVSLSAAAGRDGAASTRDAASVDGLSASAWSPDAVVQMLRPARIATALAIFSLVTNMANISPWERATACAEIDPAGAAAPATNDIV